jgi:hypothetical protein
MSEIKFDLGKDIVDTARASGVPQFDAQKVNTTIIYSVAPVPRQVIVRYSRAGYEINWQPVFGLNLYASEKRGSIADSASLSLNIDEMSDEAAQAFVEQTIAQFQKGKWKRYADPEWDVLLTGRSSILDEAGQVSFSATGAPDPVYKIPREDWLKIAKSLYLRWVGDGVVAELSVNNSPGVDGKPAYRMSLEFELLDVKVKRDAENLARDLKTGDEKGWNSTAKHEASKKKKQELNKRLIANAIKRGDTALANP